MTQEAAGIVAAAAYLAVTLAVDLWALLNGTIARHYLAPFAAVFLLILLTGCADGRCYSPVADTAERVADMDFSRRANGTLLRCETETFVYSVRAVKS